MPFINVKTSTLIGKEAEENIKNNIGNAVNVIGKTENWLMMNFEDNQKMYFAGKNDCPMAFIEVSLFGRAGADAYNQFTEKLTNIIGNELKITSDKIYVKYSETTYWGWNGSNF